MSITKQIADHLLHVHFGGNWTVTHLEEVLADVSWDEAVAEVDSFNTLVTLVYHISYYIEEQIKVLKTGVLEGSDALSFKHPEIKSPQDWENLKEEVWQRARLWSELVGQLSDDKLQEDFVDPKYGSYHRNLMGLIEHFHYHLGQIVIIKKLLRARES